VVAKVGKERSDRRDDILKMRNIIILSFIHSHKYG
jgi:hypothetical protein